MTRSSQPSFIKEGTDLLGLATAVALGIILLAVSVRWCALYRETTLIDVDEASYLQIAMADYAALQSGGLLGWVGQVLRPGLQPPLVPALTSLLFLVGGPSLQTALWMPMLASAGSVVISYMLSRALALSRGTALVMAALVGTCPLFVIFTRDYHFAVPATLVMLIALWALAKSDRFRRLSYMLLFGAALGLLPLTRTMTIAFIPGLLLGALLFAFADRGENWRKTKNLVLSSLVAFLIAGVWLLPSLRYVLSYLLSFGYGDRSRAYGPMSSIVDFASWEFTGRMILSQVLLPHGIILALGAVAGTLAFLRLVMRGQLQAVLAHPALPLVTTVVWGLAALTSTSNKGSAFVLPLLPVALVLAGRVLFGRPQARGFLAVGVVVCIVALIPQLDEGGAYARILRTELPLLGGTTVTSGRGYFVDHYNVQFRPSGGDTIGPLERDLWRVVAGDIVDYLLKQERPSAAFSFRHFLLGANQITLHAQLAGRLAQRFVQLEPSMIDETTQSYLDWLEGPAVGECTLFISAGLSGEFPPAMDAAKIKAAAALAGFAPDKSWDIPGDRVIEAWKRTGCAG